MRRRREDWIEAGLRTLAADGPEGVRVEVLARALGVTKGGFYGYFADRADLLTALLDTWEQRSVDEVLIATSEGDDVVRARRAGELTFSPELLPVDLAVRDWPRRDPDVEVRLRRVDDARMGYLRSLFADRFPDPVDLEARCHLAFCAAIATDLIAARRPPGTGAAVAARVNELLFG